MRSSVDARRSGVYGYEIHTEPPLTRLRSVPGSVGRGRLVVQLSDAELLGGVAEIIRVVREPADGLPQFALARTEARRLVAEVTQAAEGSQVTRLWRAEGLHNNHGVGECQPS